MRYPTDGGVSAIRFYLGARSPLARAAAAVIAVPHCDAGDLVCICSVVGMWGFSTGKRSATLGCACNGSSLPLYIGPPPGPDTDERAVRCPACAEPFHSAAVAVGYPRPVPPRGTLEAEQAQEIAVALRCTKCRHEHIGWHLALPAPYPARADEEWLRAIQGRFR